MYDSPFLSDGSYPLRGLILAYSSIAIIVFSLIYFVVAFIWEIKSSKQKKKTKRQVMWSKLKGMKHLAVEDFKKREKQEKLSSLMKVTRKPMKFDVRSLKKLSNPAGGESELMPPHLILPTSAPLAVSSETPLSPSSTSSGESLMDVGSDSTGALLSDSSDRSSPKSSSEGQYSTESSDRHSSGTVSSTDEATEDSEVGSEISYESESPRSETSEDMSLLSGSAGLRQDSISEGDGSILEVASSVSDEVGKNYRNEKL